MSDWIKNINNTSIDELKAQNKTTRKMSDDYRYSPDKLEQDRASIPKGCVVVNQDDILRALRASADFGPQQALTVIDRKKFVKLLFADRGEDKEE